MNDMRKLMEAIEQISEDDTNNIPAYIKGEANDLAICLIELKIIADKARSSGNDATAGSVDVAMELIVRARKFLHQAETEFGTSLDEGGVNVNYDRWKTAVPKSLNSKHLAVLILMSDGKKRERADMIRSATDMDPNPRSENGFAGWNKLDYDLYKKGLLDVVAVKGGKKIFKITAAGRKIALEANTKRGGLGHENVLGNDHEANFGGWPDEQR